MVYHFSFLDDLEHPLSHFLGASPCQYHTLPRLESLLPIDERIEEIPSQESLIEPTKCLVMIKTDTFSFRFHSSSPTDRFAPSNQHNSFDWNPSSGSPDYNNNNNNQNPSSRDNSYNQNPSSSGQNPSSSGQNPFDQRPSKPNPFGSDRSRPDPFDRNTPKSTSFDRNPGRTTSFDRNPGRTTSFDRNRFDQSPGRSTSFDRNPSSRRPAFLGPEKSESSRTRTRTTTAGYPERDGARFPTRRPPARGESTSTQYRPSEDRGSAFGR